jgi:hypothetical protein
MRSALTRYALTRYLVALLALLLITAIGAFFAYVALMPTVIATLILLGLALMFGLGVYVGNGTEPSGAATLGKSFRP